MGTRPRRWNVATSMVEIKKKTVTYAKISPKMVNPRDIAGKREEGGGGGGGGGGGDEEEEEELVGNQPQADNSPVTR